MKHKIISKGSVLSSKKIKSYSILSTAFLAAGMQANAQVTYTDVDPDEAYAGAGESYNLDLNNDGTTDFVISIDSNIYPGMFSTGTYGETFSGLVRSVNIDAAAGNGVIGSTSGANAFNAYALIGPGMSFISSSQLILDAFFGVVDYPLPGSIYYYGVFGNWVDVENKYLGLRFEDAGETYYGWARLDCGADYLSFTIKGYAYNATPDTPIETGEMVADNGINFADPTDYIEEGLGEYTGEIQIDNSADCSVDIVLNEALSTAIIGVDINFTSPVTLNFTEGGSTTLNFPVELIDDFVFVDPYYVTAVFDLENVTGGCVISSPASLELSILDDDTTLVSFDTDLTDAVENEGTISGKLNITWPVDCDLNISLSGAGTATEGIDYIFTDPTVVSFTAGGAFTEEFPIELIDDAAVEGNETIVFNLEYAGGGGCIVDPDNEDLTLTIIDNDATGIVTQEILNANVFSFDQSIFVHFDPSVLIPAGFKLFDHNGKIVYEDILMNRENTLIMNNLPNGIYTVQVISGNKKMEKNVYLWVK